MVPFTILLAEKLHNFSLSGHTHAWRIAFSLNVPSYSVVRFTRCPVVVHHLAFVYRCWWPVVRCDDFVSDYYRFRICSILLRFQPIDSTLYYYLHSYGTIVGLFSTNLLLHYSSFIFHFGFCWCYCCYITSTVCVSRIDVCVCLVSCVGRTGFVYLYVCTNATFALCPSHLEF